jgi:hypothetical protein
LIFLEYYAAGSATTTTFVAVANSATTPTAYY